MPVKTASVNNILIPFFQLITRAMAPLTLLCAITAYLQPELFLVFKPYFLYLFSCSMFALGVVMRPEELNETTRSPGSLALGVFAQYSIMPILGMCAAYLAELPPEIALGIVIVACAPGAMASNVIVYLAGGVVAFSVALTTLSTFLSPLLSPTLIELIGGVFMPIPFWPMVKTICLTVIGPLLLGMLYRRKISLARETVIAISPGIAATAIIIICAYAVAANNDKFGQLSIHLFAVVVTLNLSGYIIGWLAAKTFGFDEKKQLTLSIEIGMQNAGLGVALALQHFSSEVALPGAIFAVWCVLTAAIASAILRRRQLSTSLSRKTETE